jgi:protoheme IX farnesyltransferase
LRDHSISFIEEFKAITKFRLAISVVFSSIAAYLIAADRIDIVDLILLVSGGYALVGASNAYNQVIERHLDAKMHRTQNRPIPSGRMSSKTGLFIAVLLTLAGIVLLYFLNPKTAFFGTLSVLLYTLAYTPLKTKTPFSVFVGAIPGAIPFMLGWVAATNDFGIEPGTLFMIQFFWQFPHFWALAWMLDEDYKRGGFKLLPTGKKDHSTALQIILYTLWMSIVSIVPVFGVTGSLVLSVPAAILLFSCGLVMLYFGLKLYMDQQSKTARTLMLISVSYITILQLIYVVDHFIRVGINF